MIVFPSAERVPVPWLYFALWIFGGYSPGSDNAFMDGYTLKLP